MEDSEVVKSIGMDIEKFERRVNGINPKEDPYRNKQEIEDLERIYNNLSNRIEACEDEIQNSSMTTNKKPLINKLSQSRNDLDIAKNKFNEKKNMWRTQYNQELLKAGKLTGSDKIRTEREMILDQHKETDYQGNMIDSIASNVKDTNRNLQGINTELKEQGDQMNRIHDHAMKAETEVKQTDKIMTKMERRQKCVKVVSGIAIVIIGLFDIASLIIFLIMKFAKK